MTVEAGKPRLRGLLLAIFVSSMPATLTLPMMPSLGSQLRVSSAALGVLFGIYPLTSVIAAPVWGRISDRFGRKPALLGSLAGFRETWKPGAQHAASAAGRSAGAILVSAVVVMLMLQFLLSGLIQGTLQFSFTLWADHVLAWSAQQIALSLAALGLGFVLASGVFLRPLLRRLPASRVVLIGVLIDLTGMSIFLGHAELWRWAVTGLFVSSLGGGFWGTTIVGLLSREAPTAHQGLVMGVANGAGLIGRVAGPPLAGLAAEALGPRAPFAAIVGCLVLILLTALRSPRRYASSRHPGAPGEDQRQP